MSAEDKERINDDPQSESRKKDHIEMALKSQISKDQLDKRFYYEPILSAHPSEQDLSLHFLNTNFKLPVWVSSMTGGTELAAIINQNLAKACNEFGMGMGLGSCRMLLDSDEFLEDFNVRKVIGDQALYANLGIAQLEVLVEQNKLEKVTELVSKLQANGLIIHVNPMQEWLQPEGDRFTKAPIDTIKRVLDLKLNVIVKEVGQGMGPQSLSALLKLPLQAIDFAANGGTNFSLIELLRSSPEKQHSFSCLAEVGHSADEMVQMINQAKKDLGEERKVNEIIISGGVKNFLDGHYLMKKCELPAIYGQASAFLQHARGSYEKLQEYVSSQAEGLAVANAYLRVR